MRIDQSVIDVLSRCRVVGNAVSICDAAGRAFGEAGAVPLDRKLYEATNKILDLLGGKWSRKAKAHLFEEEPADRLENAIVTVT